MNILEFEASDSSSGNKAIEYEGRSEAILTRAVHFVGTVSAIVHSVALPLLVQAFPTGAQKRSCEKRTTH